MPKKIINIVTYLLTLGLCAFLIWLSVKDLNGDDIAKIKAAVGKANYLLLVPILIMGFVSHWSRAVRWKYLMEPLDLFPSTANTLFAVMIGYLANLAFPRLGEVLKCTILSKYEKIPADKLVGTIIAERAFDMLCLLILFVLTFVVQIDLAWEYMQSLIQRFQQKEGSSGNGGTIILAVMVLLIVLAVLFRKKIGGLAFIVKIKQVFANILSGILSFKNMKNKKGFVFHTILIWSMYMGMIMIGFYSIEETSMLTYKTGFSVLSFGSVGMIVTPGGIGAYTLLVEEIVSLYGIEKAISVAISWIIWLVPTFIILVGGAISLILLPIYNKKRDA
ncbi:MAG: flippase-like domain-containing protein [Bacteroidetes bacterium]|nr:flippase-like domain-containing protein [Bacteroidota bacterium]MBP6316094.1 flippase-like domain-containing protein [Chitinophagaceae bacterium]